MTKTSLYIPTEHLAKLHLINKTTLIPLSVLIRRGIILVLAEYGKK